MDLLSIEELQRTTGSEPLAAVVHVQMTQCLRKTTKNNKPYLEVTFADAVGSFPIKIWDNSPLYKQFLGIKDKAFYALTGYWLKGGFGMEVNELKMVPLSTAERDVLLMGSPALIAKQQADWQTIQQFVVQMRDPRFKSVCSLLMTKFESGYRRAAAARTFHHARRGGLVEHVAGMMRATMGLCTAYPHLNSDLILAGCLFHDAGKMWENGYPEADFAMPHTAAGELMGHITLGIELINMLFREAMDESTTKEWLTVSPSTAEVKLHLLHLVASHHGQLEWGAPVVPKTPEAAVLHYVDNIDAKLEMFAGAYSTAEQLAAGIYQRKMPLEGNEIAPLPSFE